ncbi:Copper-transporting ATPase RAN1 [Symbiodinium microadriaticum]|uniref:Copper-transporting ATPase RAN1 n=1 Tax=Symbiodinium microadriaticum TaxID=2951 RepID=A0A1Q9F791_SYMMI|nr:Copper-transporting ATPase RAN1 [Symbiodinium microadriaticum]
MAAKVLGKALEVVATKRAELRVEGMTCAACSGAVTRALEARQGVRAAEVNLLRQRASVDFDAAKVSEEDLCQLVEDIGFDASLVSTADMNIGGEAQIEK